MKMYSNHIIAIPPGATIKELITNRGITEKAFAEKLGVSEDYVSQLITGNIELTPNIADKLESILGVPANFWNNLEMIYREKQNLKERGE